MGRGHVFRDRTWLQETNALALAMAVVIGGAVGKLVSALVDGLIMPLLGLIIPGGEWREVKIASAEETRRIAGGRRR
jgi:large conductance mechanosensitive channel